MERIISKDMENAIEEAHMLLCYTYQALMKPPSKTDGRYEESMRVWNLDPLVRNLMPAADRALYDALMKLQ